MRQLIFFSTVSAIGITAYKKPSHTLWLLTLATGIVAVIAAFTTPSFGALLIGIFFSFAGIAGMIKGRKIFGYRVISILERYAEGKDKFDFLSLFWNPEENRAKKTARIFCAFSSLLMTAPTIFPFALKERGPLFAAGTLLVSGILVYLLLCGLLFSVIGPFFVTESGMVWVTVRDVAMIWNKGGKRDGPLLPIPNSFHILFEDGEYCFVAYTLHINKLRQMVGKNCGICLCEDVFGTEFILGTPVIDEDSADFYDPVHDSEMTRDEKLSYSLGERSRFDFFYILMAVLWNLIPLYGLYRIAQFFFMPEW